MINATKKSSGGDIGDIATTAASSKAKFPTQLLYLYTELDGAAQRAVQRRIKSGELQRIVAGVVTAAPPEEWPALIARERNRVLAALFPGAIMGYRSAFKGGTPIDGIIHLNYSYNRTVELPGLKVILVKAVGKADGDQPISGRELYYPSQARMLLENLKTSRGAIRKAVGEKEVEQRLASICEARGEDALNQIREQARAVAPGLALSREFSILERLISGILGTHANARLKTSAGKAFAAGMPYDSGRLALFEQLAAELRTQTLPQPPLRAASAKANANFAFLICGAASRARHFGGSHQAAASGPRRHGQSAAGDVHRGRGSPFWRRQRPHRAPGDECRAIGGQRLSHHRADFVLRRVHGLPAPVDARWRPAAVHQGHGAYPPMDGCL